MTVVEQRFMEVVPDALRRIATALEGINEKLELLAQRREEPSAEQAEVPEEEQVEVPEEPVTYEEVDDAVSSIRFGNRSTKRALIGALYYRDQYVGKDCASNLSRFYGGVTVKQVQEVIDSGEIEAIKPEMQEVKMSRWNDAEQRYEIFKVTRPAGKYQVSLKSTILWLERNGHRGVAQGNPVYKCIEEIISGL